MKGELKWTPALSADEESNQPKTIESEWEELPAEMRGAREYGVPGIGARNRRGGAKS